MRISTTAARPGATSSSSTPAKGNLGVSHGVFLSHGGELWAFHGRSTTACKDPHPGLRARRDNGRLEPRGVVVDDGFWPMQEPLKMDDGNWIMAGTRVANGYDGLEGHLPAVAISHGDDLTKWDVVVIPTGPA